MSFSVTRQFLNFRTIRILFLVAGMLLTTKPLIGYGIISQLDNDEINVQLLQKLFSKRKQDFLEDDLLQIVELQNRINRPVFRIIPNILQRCIMVLSLACTRVSHLLLQQLPILKIPERPIFLTIGRLII